MAGNSVKGSKAEASQPKVTSGRPTRNSSSRFAAKKPAPQEVHHGTQVVLQMPKAVTAPAVTSSTTSTAQTVDVEISMQIIQTLLHSCLSIVAHQRSIFPPNCYENRYYVTKSSEWSYNDYASGVHRVENSNGAGQIRDRSGRVIIALKKGISQRVDRFHELLEGGVFDALQRGFLASLQLSIHESPECLLDNLEAWTFSFNYMTTSTNGARSLSSIDLKDQEGSVITLHQAKLSLNDFVSKLTGLCASLPALPQEKCIVLSIGYTDTRPDEYFAPGFDQPVMDLARFPHNDDWVKTTTDVGVLNAGHHAAALVVSRLNPTNPDIPNIVPSGLECTQYYGKMDDVVVDMSERVKALQKTRTRPKPLNITNPSSSVQEQENTDSYQAPQMPHPPRNSVSRPGPKPSTLDQMEQQRVRDMLPASPCFSNDQLTQPVHPTRDDPVSQKAIDMLIVRRDILDDLDRSRSATLAPRKEITKIYTAHKHLEELTIRCSCGHQADEGDMIHCEFCESYQHLTCHGYLGKSDSRIPTTHVCYECLLKGQNECLEKVRNQAFLRRALYFLQKTSYDNNKSFGEALGCSDQDAHDVWIELQKLRLIATCGTSKKSKQRIALNLSDDARGLMEQKFFDPAFGIAGYLENHVVPVEEAWRTPKTPKRPTNGTKDKMLPAAKRFKQASAATFIDGDEVNTPGAFKA
ncbi:hypothetical protein EJ02DRAFT_509577 [Clathrospora elynae]|uniref:HORMA domain-containing protein n=1 Tax=Clathrospora elynae TaxID=706981 RepID=A0A6A5SXG0_9PLEO|nr:hypothetical protein EJ02DRAFT_509577 [Clathrospora elynae]